jgi:tRNA-(ms[2]io[6]A)-hydroxylase
MSAERLGSPYNLLDDLIVGALVEARSCERFLSLAHGLDRGLVEVGDAAELSGFYAALARSESGHATLFLDLAAAHFPAELVDRELHRRLALEERVLAEIPLSPRMHGGNGD